MTWDSDDWSAAFDEVCLERMMLTGYFITTDLVRCMVCGSSSCVCPDTNEESTNPTELEEE